WIRSHISIGDGMYKSTDAGRTWTKAGLEKSGRFARLVIHPQNPDVVLACAIGTAYGPQPERGVFRTTDGGKNWERVLFVDDNTGCVISRPIHTIRASCSPACGSSRSRRGDDSAAAPA